MLISEVIKLAEEKARKYNPEGLSPFPFQKITEDCRELHIAYGELKEDASGLIFFDKTDSTYNIFINLKKSLTRQYFTTAHEIGHYFLHQVVINNEEALIDQDETLDNLGSILFRLDNGERSVIEKEANIFAASLIMPETLVRDAWSRIKDVEECAKVFNVSIAAMSIRLERLGLV